MKLFYLFLKFLKLSEGENTVEQLKLEFDELNNEHGDLVKLHDILKVNENGLTIEGMDSMGTAVFIMHLYVFDNETLKKGNEGTRWEKKKWVKEMSKRDSVFDSVSNGLNLSNNLKGKSNCNVFIDHKVESGHKIDYKIGFVLSENSVKSMFYEFNIDMSPFRDYKEVIFLLSFQIRQLQEKKYFYFSKYYNLQKDVNEFEEHENPLNYKKKEDGNENENENVFDVEYEVEDEDGDGKDYNRVVERDQVLVDVVPPGEERPLRPDVVQAGVQLPDLGPLHRVVYVLLEHRLYHQRPGSVQ